MTVKSVRAAAGLLALVALTAAGCGGGASGTVSGKVSYKGKPLPAGTVFFFLAGGGVEHSPIGPDGTYSLAAVPAGVVKVAVKTQAPPAAAALARPPRSVAKGTANLPGTGSPAGKYVAIPRQYGDPAHSGLQYTVEKGAQTHDIALR